MTKTTQTKAPKTTKAKTASKGPTMADILTAIRTAKEVTVFLMVGGEKLHTTHKSLAEAGKAAVELTKQHKGKRPLVTAIAKDGSETTIHEQIWKQASQATPKSKSATSPEAAAAKGKRAEIAEAAAKGTLPPVPDFSAETHKRFRPKLDELKKLVAAKDVVGLKAFPINPVSSSPKALDKYRNLAVIALTA